MYCRERDSGNRMKGREAVVDLVIPYRALETRVAALGAFSGDFEHVLCDAEAFLPRFARIEKC